MNPSKAFWMGGYTIPLIVGAIPFGIVFGTLGLQSGLNFEATLMEMPHKLGLIVAAIAGICVGMLCESRMPVKQSEAEVTS